MAALLPGQLLAGAQQLAQLLDLLLWNKTATDQPMGEQIGDPGRIADIGLAGNQRLDHRAPALADDVRDD